MISEHIPESISARSPGAAHNHAGYGAHQQVMTFTLPLSGRELFVATVCAASIIVSVILGIKLHDADKDLQTQVWLRDDALTKFEQGSFADLKAHVIASEINCKR